ETFMSVCASQAPDRPRILKDLHSKRQKARTDGVSPCVRALFGVYESEATDKPAVVFPLRGSSPALILNGSTASSCAVAGLLLSGPSARKRASLNPSMLINQQSHQTPRARLAAVTLVEVVLSLAIMGISFGAIIMGYVMSARRAEWSAYSLAANSLA